MENKQKIALSALFIFLSLFIFNLLVCENESYTSSNPFCPQDTVNIEYVITPETPVFLEVREDTHTIADNQESSPSSPSLPLFGGKKTLFLNNSLSKCIPNNPCSPLQSLQIISILQKANSWHQSSDDDPSLNACC